MSTIEPRPPGPFARYDMGWGCVFCEANADNPTWFCGRCKPHKQLEDDAQELPVDPAVLEAEELLRNLPDLDNPQ